MSFVLSSSPIAFLPWLLFACLFFLHLLLQWSLAYHDGTRETDLKEMKEEDRQFIINAMDSMIMDEVKRIRILLEVLRLPDDPERLQVRLRYNFSSIISFLYCAWLFLASPLHVNI